MSKIKLLLLFIIIPIIATANEYQKAIKACPAYNNMKHTTNTNDVKLEVGKEYRVIEHKKGQILTLIKGEKIAQRWVDEECFKPKSFFDKIVSGLNKKSSTNKQTSKQNLLAISWQNAFCQTHQYKKECKNMSADDFGASHFVLHGLWPQPRNNLYCNVDKKQIGMDKNKQWYRLNKLDLNSTVKEELQKYMPGYSSNLHRHEWIKHGTCYKTDANRYYADAINLLKQVNSSKVQKFFAKNIGRTVTIKDIRKIFDEEFGKGAGEHVSMNCKNGLITELWLYIGSGSDNLKELLQKGKTVKSKCYKGKIDAVGF
jgi:ribonuclease T2